jgi:hypothetical protein
MFTVEYQVELRIRLWWKVEGPSTAYAVYQIHIANINLGSQVEVRIRLLRITRISIYSLRTSTSMGMLLASPSL